MKNSFKKTIIYILKLEAWLVLKRYRPKIVAITGSVGKTSTKDAVYGVFSKITHVRKSEKSYNSQIGLPLTILGLPNAWNNLPAWILNFLKGFWLIIWPHKYPEWLILEVGVGKPGDMKETASWIKTDAIIFTAIGETPAHIEFFDSRDHLLKEKAGLLKTLKKDGILVLNADDKMVLDLKNKTKNRIITYGFSEDVDVRASEENILYADSGEPRGIVFRIDEEGKSLPVMVEGVFSRNQVYVSLASLALAFGLKLNMLDATNALKNYDLPPGRMRLLAGINDSFIIDDTYNSSPVACQSAVKTLGEVKSNGRKIAVLGDMLELGKHTIEAHQDIGKLVKENSDILIAVGQRAVHIKEGALEAKMKEKNIYEFLNSTEAGEFLKNFVQKNDLVLIKGSQSMRMERAVEVILLDQKNKSNLLVRQDPEWLAKK